MPQPGPVPSDLFIHSLARRLSIHLLLLLLSWHGLNLCVLELRRHVYYLLLLGERFFGGLVHSGRRRLVLCRWVFCMLIGAQTMILPELLQVL